VGVDFGWMGANRGTWGEVELWRSWARRVMGEHWNEVSVGGLRGGGGRGGEGGHTKLEKKRGTKENPQMRRRSAWICVLVK